MNALKPELLELALTLDRKGCSRVNAGRAETSTHHDMTSSAIKRKIYYAT